MPFQPNNITKQHVLDAVEKIENENLELQPSTGLDVVINGKAFPPKEIMRYAHEQMNGVSIEMIGTEHSKNTKQQKFQCRSQSNGLITTVFTLLTPMVI